MSHTPLDGPDGGSREGDGESESESSAASDGSGGIVDRVRGALGRVGAAVRSGRRRGLSNVPVVTGNIPVPVLSLHNLGDLFVPFHNEVVYEAEVAAQGKSDLLVQRAIRGVNHCGFTTTEYETAFTDLVTWVEQGIRPAGDDVGDPTVVASPDFGCQFTDFTTPGGHLLPAPCP
jgi:hypothetical protein